MTEQKTVVVTGGTSGIGRAVVADLVARGDRVIAIGRDTARDAPAGAEIVRADLTLMRETARATEEITAQVDRLDAVVLCAGVFSTAAEWTDEGFERTLALNYLSRFLLVSRLLPLLTEPSPSLADPSRGRVVLVANAGKYPDTLDLTDLQMRSGGRGLKVAGRTQFANDVLAIELAERTELVAGCVYPGLVATDVFRNARGLSRPMRSAVTGLHRLLARSPAAAADTPVHLARDCGVTSGFYGPGHRRLPVPQRLDDPRRRQEIWEATERTLELWLSRTISQG